MSNLMTITSATLLHQEIKAILEGDIPTSSGPLSIVEITYDDLFDPAEMAHLSEIPVSLVGQQQHAEVSGPTLSGELLHDTSTSPVEGESSTPVQMTTIEVPMIKDAAPVSTYRVTTQSNVSTDSEDGEIGNIDTRTSSRIITHSSIQGEPSFVLGELPSAVQREPQSNADQNPTV